MGAMGRLWGEGLARVPQDYMGVSPPPRGDTGCLQLEKQECPMGSEDREGLSTYCPGLWVKPRGHLGGAVSSLPGIPACWGTRSHISLRPAGLPSFPLRSLPSTDQMGRARHSLGVENWREAGTPQRKVTVQANRRVSGFWCPSIAEGTGRETWGLCSHFPSGYMSAIFSLCPPPCYGVPGSPSLLNTCTSLC